MSQGGSEPLLAAQHLFGQCNLGKSSHPSWGPGPGWSLRGGGLTYSCCLLSQLPASCSIQAAGRMDALLQGDPSKQDPTTFTKGFQGGVGSRWGRKPHAPPMLNSWATPKQARFPASRPLLNARCCWYAHSHRQPT